MTQNWQWRWAIILCLSRNERPGEGGSHQSIEGIRLSSKLEGHSGVRNTLKKDDFTGLLFWQGNQWGTQALSHKIKPSVTPQSSHKYMKSLTADCSSHLVCGGTIAMVSYVILTRLSELLFVVWGGWITVTFSHSNHKVTEGNWLCFLGDSLETWGYRQRCVSELRTSGHCPVCGYPEFLFHASQFLHQITGTCFCF